MPEKWDAAMKAVVCTGEPHAPWCPAIKQGEQA